MQHELSLPVNLIINEGSPDVPGTGFFSESGPVANFFSSLGTNAHNPVLTFLSFILLSAIVIFAIIFITRFIISKLNPSRLKLRPNSNSGSGLNSSSIKLKHSPSHYLKGIFPAILALTLGTLSLNYLFTGNSANAELAPANGEPTCIQNTNYICIAASSSSLDITIYKASSLSASQAHTITVATDVPTGYVLSAKTRNQNNQVTATLAGSSIGDTDLTLSSSYQSVHTTNTASPEGAEDSSSLTLNLTIDPALAAGTYPFILDYQVAIEVDVEEIWGFTLDTSISDEINFFIANTVPMQADFGDGNWINFATATNITGTAIPDVDDGPLSHIRIRPQDEESYDWLPVGVTDPDNDQVPFIGAIEALVTLDYPVTTRGISNPSGRVRDGALTLAFMGAINLTTPVNFANSEDVTITEVGDLFLAATHQINTSLTSTIDLSALASWQPSSIGNYFLGGTHIANSLLTSPIDLSPLADWRLTSVHDAFLYGSHLGNPLMISPINLTPLGDWGVDTIGDDFMSEIHSENLALVDPIDLSPLGNWSVSSIGNHFLNSAHVGNESLISPINLSGLENWTITSIGNLFLTWAHSSNSSLTTPIDLTPLASWNVESIGDEFLSYIHEQNTQLAAPLDLSPLADWNVESIGDYFLSSVHEDNTQLVSPLTLAPLTNWDIDPAIEVNGFLAYAHYNNSAMLDISQFRLPVWAKGIALQGVNLYYTFGLYSPIADTGGEPTYTDGTFISSVGTPDSGKDTYFGRNSIEPLNPGWK